MLMKSVGGVAIAFSLQSLCHQGLFGAHTEIAHLLARTILNTPAGAQFGTTGRGVTETDRRNHRITDGCLLEEKSNMKVRKSD